MAYKLAVLYIICLAYLVQEITADGTQGKTSGDTTTSDQKPASAAAPPPTSDLKPEEKETTQPPKKEEKEVQKEREPPKAEESEFMKHDAKAVISVMSIKPGEHYDGITGEKIKG